MNRFCFTVDTEFYHRLPYDKAIQATTEGLERLLELLSQHEVQATFFVTGTVVEHASELVDHILAGGHEVGAHGLTHTDLRTLERDEMGNEIRRITERLEEHGITPEGFRAPDCSYRDDLLSVLSRHGYRYDSSLHPTYVPGRYNNVMRSRTPFTAHGVVEIPITVAPLIRAPLGWFWLRQFGAVYGRAITHLSARTDGHVVLYVHPWDFASLPDSLPRYLRRNSGKAFVRTVDRYLDAVTAGHRTVHMGNLAEEINS